MKDVNLQADKIKISQAFIEGINTANIKLFEFIKNNFDDVESIFPLIEFTLERLSTVTELAINGNNWDAEIVYRSALECLIKLTFISSVDGEERKTRLKEYWEDLREITMLKQSEQAKRNLVIYKGDETMRLGFAPLLLTDEQETALRKKWPRLERKRIEHKWSFSEMIASMANNYKGAPAIAFLGLAHNYRYASHVSHADETGVLIIKERAQRPNVEREIADFAHYIKHLSDVFYFCISLSIHVLGFAKKDASFFIDLANSMTEISQLANVYLERLQMDKSYDKFRYKVNF